jgi:hypothetical protein
LSAATLRLDVAARVVVLRNAEGCAAPALRRVVRRLGDAARFLGALHHRHHDPIGADIQRARHEVVLAARHAHERLDADAAAAGRQHLQGLEAQARVLHVEERELAARGLQHLRHAGREEFEDHRAGDGFAAQHLLADRARPHSSLAIHALPGPVRRTRP